MNHLGRYTLCFSCFALTLGWMGEASWAQRGGGARGGARGNVSRGGHSIQRSPSMSHRNTGNVPKINGNRPANFPNGNRPNVGRPNTGNLNTGNLNTGRPNVGRPQGAQQPGTTRPANRPNATGSRPTNGFQPGSRPPTGTRPSPGSLDQFLDLNRPGNRPAGGGAAADFLQNRPPSRPGGDRPGGDRPGGDRPGGDRPGGNYPGQDRPGSLPPGYRPPGSRPPGYRPPGYRPPRPIHYPVYGPGYWGGNWRWHWGDYNQNWWAWATAGAVTSWLNYGRVNQPIYYDYGNNIYYEGDQVYYDGQPIATAAEYAGQAQSLVNNVPDVNPDDVQWMPLGVFALAQQDETAEDATLFLQLAISKQGIIAGTLQNTATGKATEVEGTVDEERQRAAWGPVGKAWPIMETGVYNLTENDLGALVHFADGTTQQWSLSRLDEPDKDRSP